MAEKVVVTKKYENNPFFIATNGISLLFDLARGVAILFAVLSVFSLFRGDWNTGNTNANQENFERIGNTLAAWTVNEWVFAIGAVAIVTLALMLIGALFGGVSSYTSAQLAKGKSVGFGEAFRVAFEHLWSFLWLQIIIFVKVLLWTLLFIIPGIIMAVRYSLASTAFFDDKKNLRGNAAIKESLRLTKGAWITTYAAGALLNLLTFGIISQLVSTGVNAILYRQYEQLETKEKPNAHWLSWLTLFLPFILIALLLLFVTFLVIVVGLAGGKFSE